MPTPDPVRYDDSLETPLPDEETVITETIAAMAELMRQSFETHRHTHSATHAKTHAVVVGHLQVADGLPAELAQGLFASPGRYEAVVRYASEPGALAPDRTVQARGLALKVLGVQGDLLVDGWGVQDFLLNTWPIIPMGDAVAFRDVMQTRARGDDPPPSVFESTPNIHPVAFTFYSQGAFRHGDHVAKYSLAPVGPAQLALAGRTVTDEHPDGVLSHWLREFFAAGTATYELRAQLLTDPASMPVEDASVQWSEQLSPYRTVATLTLGPQESFSPTRRVLAEDVMSWRPWNGLAAHRPLGSINRLRRRGYVELGARRHAGNAREEANPRTLADVPD